ncbi:hypothetical protein [Rhizobium tubonense]|uniref:Uncharacterized protein n=1 Tax=Rhizobium tubonense TaxID=484088 RepID=A0A2W4C2I2_9HYPH|nr:hypothetical protein [Rhizobium tubonense]PZM08029.1 hypothetical protein CPY51_30225 [Rhizobium tubonense]
MIAKFGYVAEDGVIAIEPSRVSWRWGRYCIYRLHHQFGPRRMISGCRAHFGLTLKKLRPANLQNDAISQVRDVAMRAMRYQVGLVDKSELRGLQIASTLESTISEVQSCATRGLRKII